MVKKYKSEAGGRQILETYDSLVRQWGVETHEEDVQTQYGKTHLITAGNPVDPPLVLFHGVGDDAALMWLVNARDLAKHFHIIAVDTMGGPGKSEPNDSYYKDFDQTTWIDGILESKGLARVYIVGVSNGAYLTQRYTATRPDRVIKALCMAGSIAVKGAKSPMWRMMKVFLPEALFPSERNAIKLMKKLSGDHTAIDTLTAKYPALMRHYVSLLKYFNTQSMFSHKITGFDNEQIAIIREKTRILIGACDKLSYHSGAIESLKIHHMNFRAVENTGHALNMEAPALVYEEIVRFLLGSTV